MNYKPLDDLEMFDIITLAYPDLVPDETDESWGTVMDFVDSTSGFDEIADLLGRVIMLTMPSQSILSKDYYHCLGKVDLSDGIVDMEAVVTRKVVV